MYQIFYTCEIIKVCFFLNFLNFYKITCIFFGKNNYNLFLPKTIWALLVVKTYVKTQRKVMSDSRKFFPKFCPPPPFTVGSSKRYNFFSIGSLLSLEKYVRQKFSLCLFSKKQFDFVCFPPFLPLFFKKVGLFCLK